MADILTPAGRSERMSRIRGKDTRPELRLRKALHPMGLRYRLHPRELPGAPDLVFPRHRAVVFVHGCFWHQHPGCKGAHIPLTNTEFWRAKFEANRRRDARTQAALRKLGWRVAVAWECKLSSVARVGKTAARIARFVRRHT